MAAEGTAEVLGGAAGTGEQGKNMSRRSLKATVGPKEEIEVGASCPSDHHSTLYRTGKTHVL